MFDFNFRRLREIILGLKQIIGENKRKGFFWGGGSAESSSGSFRPCLKSWNKIGNSSRKLDGVSWVSTG